MNQVDGDPISVVTEYDRRLRDWQRSGGSEKTRHYVPGSELRLLVNLAKEALDARIQLLNSQ